MLVEHGFRLPSARDNRPLRFEEVMERLNQVVFLSATPGRLRAAGVAAGRRADRAAHRPGRPRGHRCKPTKGQIDDLLEQINQRVTKGDRVLVTTLTKKMAEDLTDYLLELGVRVRYLHSEIDTVQRIEILRGLRLGEFDVLVGINLLREGLDLPEVSLVAILDADKEGFLRSETSLIQTIGRAARNVDGQVVMYADNVTDSMQRAIERDQPAPRLCRSQYNARARHRPADDPQGGHRHPVAAAAGRGARPFPGGTAASSASATRSVSPSWPSCPRPSWSASSRRSRRRCTTAAAELRFEYAARLRDEVNDLDGSSVRRCCSGLTAVRDQSATTIEHLFVDGAPKMTVVSRCQPPIPSV